MRQSLYLSLLLSLLMVAGCATAPSVPHTGLDSPRTLPDTKAQEDSSAGAPLQRLAANYLAATFANRQNDFTAATEFIDALDAKDETLLAQKLILTVIKGDVETAIRESGALKPNDLPDENVALLLQTLDAFSKKEYPKARALMEQSTDQFSGIFIKPLVMAWVHAALQDEAAAESELHKLEAIGALKPLQNLHTGFIYLGFDKPLQAKPYLEDVLKSIQEPNVRYVLLAIDFYNRIYDAESAEAYLEAIKTREPDSEFIPYLEAKLADRSSWIQYTPTQGLAEAFYDIGTIFAAEGRPRQALFYGQIARYLDSENPIHALFVANLFRQLNRYEDAVRIYESLKTIPEPFRYTALYRQSEALFLDKKTEQALALVGQLIQEYPDRHDLRILRGDMYREQKKYPEAIESYTAAISMIETLQPRHWGVLYARGVAYEQSGQWPLAESDFQKSIELDPNQPAVLNYLGYSWIDRKTNIKEGKELIIRAVSLRPNNGFIIDSLGWALFRLGNYEEAVQYLEQAVNLEPSDPVIVDHYGDALWKTGRRQEATFMWQQALSFKPDLKLQQSIEKKLREGLKTESPPS